jgi:hypothetical protein
MALADQGIVFPITYTRALLNHSMRVIDADLVANCATFFRLHSICVVISDSAEAATIPRFVCIEALFAILFLLKTCFP